MQQSNHAILLGDSIFDNAIYVPGCPPVIDQVKEVLGVDWNATLLAVDGSIAADVPRQLKHLPQDASHLIVSVGGNDALQNSHVLEMENCSAAEVFHELASARHAFRTDYRRMLDAVTSTSLPTAVCTVYDAIPWPDSAMREITSVALAVFNDCIITDANAYRLPILDLRKICDQPEDYSTLSPIEPSVRGGEKISRAIAKLLREHDFSSRAISIYP